MRHLLPSTLIILMGCAKVQIEAPESMPTTTIRHEIVISVEMKNMFYEQCKQELQTTDETLIKLCADNKEYEFIQQVLTIIEQNKNNQGN